MTGDKIGEIWILAKRNVINVNSSSSGGGGLHMSLAVFGSLKMSVLPYIFDETTSWHFLQSRL